MERMDNLKHVILIRFCLGKDIKWLKKREKEFYAWTFPSLVGQTNQNFEVWLLHSLLEEANFVFPPDFKLVKIKNRGAAPAEGEIERIMDWDISTRLDSDDALSLDYVERVQALASTLDIFKNATLLDFPDGYYEEHGVYYKRRWMNSPFCTVIGRGRHVWEDQHGFIHKHFQNILRVDGPAWIHVKHKNSSTYKTDPFVGQQTELEGNFHVN